MLAERLKREGNPFQGRKKIAIMSAIKQDQLNRIANLFDKVRELEESKQNKQRLSLWESFGGHGQRIPKRELLNAGHSLVSTVIAMAHWSRLLGFDVEEYYHDPAVLLEQQLRMKIFQFKTLPDDNPIDKSIGLWLGSGFEASLLGVGSIWQKDDDPWVGRNPVIRSRADLDYLPPLDFYQSGLMPLAHRLYNGIHELLPDDFSVGFPDFIKGPFGLAMQLYGMEQTAIALIEDTALDRNRSTFNKGGSLVLKDTNFCVIRLPRFLR